MAKKKIYKKYDTYVDTNPYSPSYNKVDKKPATENIDSCNDGLLPEWVDSVDLTGKNMYGTPLGTIRVDKGTPIQNPYVVTDQEDKNKISDLPSRKYHSDYSISKKSCTGYACRTISTEQASDDSLNIFGFGLGYKASDGSMPKYARAPVFDSLCRTDNNVTASHSLPVYISTSETDIIQPEFGINYQGSLYEILPDNRTYNFYEPDFLRYNGKAKGKQFAGYRFLSFPNKETCKIPEDHASPVREMDYPNIKANQPIRVPIIHRRYIPDVDLCLVNDGIKYLNDCPSNYIIVSNDNLHVFRTSKYIFAHYAYDGSRGDRMYPYRPEELAKYLKGSDEVKGKLISKRNHFVDPKNVIDYPKCFKTYNPVPGGINTVLFMKKPLDEPTWVWIYDTTNYNIRIKLTF